MPNMPCNAFLQPHVRPVTVHVTCGARLIPGTKVGVWRIDGEPHWSARSASYAVVLPESGDRATMTVFDAPALHLGSYPRRMIAIAQSLTTIDHPGVASVVDAGVTADGRPYVVTELEQAIPLAECMATMDVMRALTVLRAVCAPLLAAHDVGIAHGSLELEHVFLIESDARYVRLADWGIERAVFDEARRAGLDSKASSPGAPEAALGLCSPQMDAYALGALATRLLPEIPAALADLVHELMADDPRRRPTVRSAAHRLGLIQAELATPMFVAPDVVELPRHRPPWAGIACAVMAAAASVALLVHPDDAPPSTMAAAVAPAASAPAPILIEPPRVAAVTPHVPVAALAVAAPAKPASLAVAAPAKPASPAVAAPAKPTMTGKPRAKTRPVAADDSPRNELLAQYQRVGRALYKLQEQRGVAATSELMHQFRALAIQPALATHESRAAAAAVLGELRTRVERQQGIEVADACLKNALADGCR